MKNYFFCISIFFLSSCCKPNIETQTLYNNTTSDNIEVRAYNNGKFNTSLIAANSTTIASFISYDYGIEVDSIRLFIDGKYKQTHYAAGDKKYASSVEVPFEDAKNLLNFANYQKSVEKQSCGGHITSYVYTF